MTTTATMTTFRVYHARPVQDARGRVIGIKGSFGFEPTAFPEDYEFVATVVTTAPGAVFQLTNHIDAPWPENDGVTLAPGVRADRVRSTSVGDVIGTPDGYLVIAPVGLRPFDAPAVPRLY